MELFVWIGPIAIAYLVYRAMKGTKVIKGEMSKTDDQIMDQNMLGAANSLRDMNQDDSYGVK
jgi:hypothetical protein